ncbi:uncharacterized protein LOC121267144 [Juglans microcarpa x Juglans regia]|uniref:uncharacterized protein LOC121267144 n=1 Tax=Juglans microcarpa x Juglans regia TaxID=2249226 RepID=UPI001B7D9128|nr:uncharacterized protein LOC121267144 [Juglans microcarpa x Juglans regia]
MASKRIPSAVHNPVTQLDANAKVKELIKLDEKRWDMKELVEQLFDKDEADIIVQIPISSSSSSGKMIWKGTSSGIFTVRSAYYMHKERSQAIKGQASSSHDFKKTWKFLWHLQVTPGDRVFMWRTCLNALPTQSNLFKRKIVDHPKCSICNLEEETATHALWECESTRDVWSQCLKSLQKSHFSKMNMLEIFEAIAGIMDTDCLQEFAMVAKQIWWRRNEFIFNQVFRHPNTVVSAASQNLKMLKEMEGQRSSSVPTNSSITEWQAPPMHFHKLNWDVVVDKTRARVGIDIVVRNFEGKIIAIMRRNQCMFPLPSLTEAYGALQVVSFALELGLTKVIIEGDSLQTVQALKKDEDQLTCFGMFVS